MCNLKLIKAAVYGGAIGDAIGVPYDFIERMERDEEPITDMVGHKEHDQEPGTWSEDTSMVVATIYGLRKHEFDVNFIADEFVSWYCEGKHTANGEAFNMSNSIKAVIVRIMGGKDPRRASVVGWKSLENGSLMRMLPLAFFLHDEIDFRRRKEVIYEASAITHAHIVTKAACHFFVEFAIRLINNIPKEEAYIETAKDMKLYYLFQPDVTRAFERLFSDKVRTALRDNISSSNYVVSSLEAAIWTLFNSSSFEGAVLKAVNLGWDCNTIGSLTGQLAGIVYGYNNVPGSWKRKLVNRRCLWLASMRLWHLAR